MSNLCNLDGVILPEQQATVPVLDRSFLFGDSIYEVVRTIDGAPFAWAEHWRRLELSADSLLMPLDQDERTVARRVAQTLAAVDHGESYVRIIVSRGTGLAPNIDLDYAPGPQRWVLMVRPLTQTFGKPARLAMVPRRRNDRRALDPASKSGNYLNNVLGLAEAKAAGATDCVMLNSDGLVTEASTSNLFARLDGTWCTPPLAAGILAGITRQLLLQFLPQIGERVIERDLRAEDLQHAEELFLSSTLRDIGPVTHLDGRELHGADKLHGADIGGPHTRRIAPLFAAHIRERMRTSDAPHWRELTQSS